MAILTQALWRRSFGSDVSIIGKTVSFQEESRMIIGVLPAEFRFPAEMPDRNAEILLPFPAKWDLTSLGRLRPSRTP